MEINKTHTIIAPKGSEGSQQNPGQTAEAKAQDVRQKRERIPMSVPRRKLDVPELPGFFCYWFKDEGPRLQQAMRAGYTFVTDEEIMNAGGVSNHSPSVDEASGSSTDVTSQVSVYSGVAQNGAPQRLILMKLPDELRAEDMEEAARIAGVPMNTIMRGKPLPTAFSNPVDDAAAYVNKNRLQSGVHRSVEKPQ